MHPSSIQHQQQRSIASAPRRSCRARHSHEFVPIPDHVLKSSTSSPKQRHPEEDNEEDEDPFPSRQNKNEKEINSSSSSSSSSSPHQQTFEETIGWGALRAKTAELTNNNNWYYSSGESKIHTSDSIATTEDALVADCADLRSLEAKV